MVASQDTCPLCDKPFYGKQKFIRCSACDIHVHSMCLQLGEAELASLTATGENLYKCSVCKALGSRSMDTTQAQLQESLPNEGEAAISASSNEEVSSVIAVSNQLDISSQRTSVASCSFCCS
jgi:hypothetical protein